MYFFDKLLKLNYNNLAYEGDETMIFDKDFDESLWLILESDAEKRGEIIHFLKSIPNELIENVREILTSEIDEDADCIPDYEGSVVAEDGTVYSYLMEFDDQEKTLEITQQFATPSDSSYINMSVSLNLVKEIPPYEVLDGEKMWIGNFTRAMSVVGCDSSPFDFGEGRFLPFVGMKDGEVVAKGKQKELESEYYIVKNKAQYDVVRFNCTNGVHEVLPIDKNNMPEELSISYIDKRYGQIPKTKELILPNND